MDCVTVNYTLLRYETLSYEGDLIIIFYSVAIFYNIAASIVCVNCVTDR